MRQLDISPLPSMETADDHPGPEWPGDGFVEDSVVLAILTAADPHDVRYRWPVVGQAASALDYAGWPPGEPVRARAV